MILQSYPHKILTGRRDKMSTIRQTNGLSGFTKRAESEYDCFGTGHSSTSISAALGTISSHLSFYVNTTFKSYRGLSSFSFFYEQEWLWVEI